MSKEQVQRNRAAAMASVSRSTSRLGEERIPLSFKVVMEPELGSSRPAGTTGEDFRANRMVSPRPRSSSAQADRAQLACPCGARDEVRTIDANARHSLLQAPLCLCLRILPGCPRQLVYAALQKTGMRRLCGLPGCANVHIPTPCMPLLLPPRR